MLFFPESIVLIPVHIPAKKIWSSTASWCRRSLMVDFYALLGVRHGHLLHHPEDHQLVEFVKKIFVSITSTLRLYHELLRNKHNEILLGIASGFCQHTPKLKKSNKRNRFPELHHPEDHQLIEFVKKIFFPLTRLCGFATSFWGTSTMKFFLKLLQGFVSIHPS